MFLKRIVFFLYVFIFYSTDTVGKQSSPPPPHTHILWFFRTYNPKGSPRSSKKCSSCMQCFWLSAFSFNPAVCRTWWTKGILKTSVSTTLLVWKKSFVLCLRLVTRTQHRVGKAIKYKLTKKYKGKHIRVEIPMSRAQYLNGFGSQGYKPTSEK